MIHSWFVSLGIMGRNRNPVGEYLKHCYVILSRNVQNAAIYKTYEQKTSKPFGNKKKLFRLKRL